MSSKQQLGQFFTDAADMVLRGFAPYVAGKTVFDPFAGAGDLLRWAQKHGASAARGCDIDARLADNAMIFHADSFAAPTQAEFIITNPPYLYQNKMADKRLLAGSRHTDLYQLALEQLMPSKEGIVIIPVNFLSAENAKYIRQIFLERFALIKVNYFTQAVFADTDYNVIAFYYRRKPKPAAEMAVDVTFCPQRRQEKLLLERRYGWQIGGDFLARVKAQGNRLGISRLEDTDIKPGAHAVRAAYTHLSRRRTLRVCGATYALLRRNIIILKAIDTGSAGGEICLEDIRHYGCEALVSVKTSRNQIQLLFPPQVGIAAQERLIELFNAELASRRARYHSLFMTNYRDKDRKRISFTFAYKLLNVLYQQHFAQKERVSYAAG